MGLSCGRCGSHHQLRRSDVTCIPGAEMRRILAPWVSWTPQPQKLPRKLAAQMAIEQLGRLGSSAFAWLEQPASCRPLIHAACALRWYEALRCLRDTDRSSWREDVPASICLPPVPFQVLPPAPEPSLWSGIGKRNTVAEEASVAHEQTHLDPWEY
jgi:hypothetical protein